MVLASPSYFLTASPVLARVFNATSDKDSHVFSTL